MKDGRILAVGSDADIEAHVGESTEVIELEGRLAIPGFIEGHGHFMGLGNAKMILDLTTVNNWNEIVTMVGDAAQEAEPGEWITAAAGTRRSGMPSRRAPSTACRITRGSPRSRRTTRSSSATRAATPPSPTPGRWSSPGSIATRPTRTAARSCAAPTASRRARSGRRRSGSSEASSRIYLDQRSPEQQRADAERQVELACEDLLSKGVTSFHDAGASFDTIDFFKEMAEAGKLPVRLYAMVRRESNEVMDEKLPDYKMTNAYDGHLTVRSIKRQIDGALGPHGAWLLEPYEDHESTGLVLETVEDIAGTAAIAVKHGYQVNTHAIGDRANRKVLDIYEEAFEEGRERREGPALADRARAAHSPGRHPALRRARRDRLDAGHPLHLGRPLGLQAARRRARRVRRLRLAQPHRLGRGGDERHRRPGRGRRSDRELLRVGRTHHRGRQRVLPRAGDDARRGARVLHARERLPAFEEDVKGSLTPGKYADIAVLSKDILTIPADEIPTSRVDLTIVGGEVLYRR